MFRVLSRKLSQAERGDDTKLYKNLELKFSLFGDPLFDDEEQRWKETNERRHLIDICGESNIHSTYFLELAFDNIKHFSWQEDPTERVRDENDIGVSVWIQLHRPCSS